MDEQKTDDSEMRHLIADLLLDHQPSFQCDGDFGEIQWVECTCDDQYFVETEADYKVHAQHQAAVLVERLFPRVAEPEPPASTTQEADRD